MLLGKQIFTSQVGQGERHAKHRVPYSVPGVDLAVVHVVLLSSVENKFTFVGSIFLIKNDPGRKELNYQTLAKHQRPKYHS